MCLVPSEVLAQLDKTGDGLVKIEDMEGTYDCKNHPKVAAPSPLRQRTRPACPSLCEYVSGEKSKEEIFKEFLKTFEVGGHVDGIVSHFHPSTHPDRPTRIR